ncbi:MAG: desulfoferrodoxin family protein [bacterium]
MFVCKMCGHVHFGTGAPDVCPVCHAPASAFNEDREAIKTPADAGNLTGAEKKHQPVITRNDTVINVTVGDILHPMEAEHWIMFIDLYVDDQYQSRTAFLPGTGLLPIVEKVWNDKTVGEIKAVACCNKHGRWAASLREESREEGVYRCVNCGMTSTTKQHLCSPASSKFVCSYCGLEVDNVRHVCEPKANEMKYVCGACGRMAVNGNELCMPDEIR